MLTRLLLPLLTRLLQPLTYRSAQLPLGDIGLSPALGALVQARARRTHSREGSGPCRYTSGSGRRYHPVGILLLAPREPLSDEAHWNALERPTHARPLKPRGFPGEISTRLPGALLSRVSSRSLTYHTPAASRSLYASRLPISPGSASTVPTHRAVSYGNLADLRRARRVTASQAGLSSMALP